MTFREQISEDFQVFLSLEEFAQEHMINGRSIPCVIDNNELLERRSIVKNGEKTAKDGLFLASILLYARTEDLHGKPILGGVMTVDGKQYRVTDVTDEMGICSVCLEAKRQ